MSTSSLLKFNIDNDLIYGNTHFVEEGATFNWEIALMSNVSLYNGTGTSSFKTITFTTNSNKTQVLLGFNVLDKNGNVLSQIGANGRLKILEIYDANYGTNNRLRQYEDKKVQLTDTRYAQVVESGVDTGLNRFQLSIIPTDDLILEPVVSDVGYSVYYQCTGVTSQFQYGLRDGYSNYYDNRGGDEYTNRLTCMSYKLSGVSSPWNCFTVYGYYDGSIDVESNYCPDINSSTVTYTLSHTSHNGQLTDTKKETTNCKLYTTEYYDCLYCYYDYTKDSVKDAHVAGQGKYVYKDEQNHAFEVRCVNCSKLLSSDLSAHEFTEWENADTFIHRRSCKACTAVEEKGHDYPQDWQPSPGSLKCNKQCKVCSRTLEKDHDPIKDTQNSTAATCTTAGTTRYMCKDCAGTIPNKTDIVEALGHTIKRDDSGNWVVEWVSHSTCTVGGTYKHICGRCSQSYGETKTVSALGHKYDNSHYVEEDIITYYGETAISGGEICSGTGKARYRVCARCGGARETTYFDADPYLPHSVSSYSWAYIFPGYFSESGYCTNCRKFVARTYWWNSDNTPWSG